jgi:Abortive infection alpha
MEASRPERGEDDRGRSRGEDAMDAGGLARLTLGAWVRTAEWTLGSTARAGRRVARAVLSGESVPDLIDDARSSLRGLLGVNEIEDRIAGLISGDRDGDATAPLRDRGAELLQSSADVVDGPPLHPAYENILRDLAPDEARILRLLAGDGPQAAVDIRTWRPLDVGSRLVAPGLSMIARNAGVQFPDSVPQYLNNLNRLGLIWFSREPLEDGRSEYQVLEAQPEVLEAIKATGRARVVRRSVHLTAFGEDFCGVALPDDAGPPTGEFQAVVDGGEADEPDYEDPGMP